MSMISRRSAFALAFAFAALCFGAPAAQAQSNLVPYWTTTTAFGSALTSDTNVNAFGSFSTRYNFENGWFIGSERGNLGFGPNSFSAVSALGSASSFTYEGTQAGYNFKSAPVSVYAGLDTLRYNGPVIGSPFSALDSGSSGNLPSSYRVNAGVEFRPTSNLSLSFGASFAQQPTDMNAALLPGATPMSFGRR
ncbi:outer membrane beta-barrel protein [Bradyrhizobium sp.]|uniref:outer membrane beta-barrel protein n=1 Tax=Bradyrhizobium sp. TaxID=376 RepID=UPI002623E637|nr:outer membrane beta-barrel protein [Bradyrhizobium sp.]